jgi:hypothetical protein
LHTNVECPELAFEQLESETFWRNLAPGLPIWREKEVPAAALDQDEAIRTGGIFDREGYIQVPDSQDVALIGLLARLVAGIRGNGLLPVFAFLYDAMWQPYRRIGPVLDCVLGGPHTIMPHLWAWHVDPGLGEAGWGPHRDRPDLIPRPNLWSKSVSVWIPLTEATTLNGCMYVMPKHRDPHYGMPMAQGLAGTLADVRALPAVPGDTLIWTQLLLHWGCRSSELATGPRLSMSIEFQRADGPALSDFCIGPEQSLTFEQKLGLIGRAILNYRHMHPVGEELSEAATRWADRVPLLFGPQPGHAHAGHAP